MTEHEDWLNRLASLHVANTEMRGLAPHKPLLLLSVMDMIDDGSLKEPWIPYSPELFFRFSTYWVHVYDRQRNQPNMRLPFHALGGARDRIWARYTDTREPSRSRDTTGLVHMDEGLWSALQDAVFRRAARTRLVAAYFQPLEQLRLCAQLRLPEPTTDAIAAIRQDAAEYKKSLKKGRDAKFRSEVLLGYNFTCALTGYRLCTNNEHMVEAAHIHEHAKSGNDDPRNGLALTPDAHWMFDRGLWTAEPVDGGCVVRVAMGRYQEASLLAHSLAQHHGRRLHLETSRSLFPDPGCLAWHRNNVFLGGL